MTAITVLSSDAVAAILAVEVHDRQRQQADRQTQSRSLKAAADTDNATFSIDGCDK